jgi:WD40 repeat protein
MRTLSLAAVTILLGGTLLSADGPPKKKETVEVRQFSYGIHIRQLVFSPDGKLVVTDDQIWDAGTGKKIRTLPLPPLKERGGSTPFRLAFSPDSWHVAIHRYDDLVLVEVASGKELWTVKLPNRNPYYSLMPGLAFTPDGTHLVTARNDEGLVRVFAVANGKEIRKFPYDSDVGGLTGAAIESFGISADGKRLVVHRYEYLQIAGLVLLDLETGKELARHRLSEEEAPARFSVLSPGGRHVFYTKKGSIHMIDVKTGKEIRRFDSNGEYAYSVCCSHDEKYVVAGVLEKAKTGSPHWIEFWDIATSKTIRVIQGNGALGSPTLSPDGRFLLTTFNEKTAQLWRLEK